MFDKFRKTIMVLAVLGAIAVGASALASAASKGGTTGQQGNSSGATAPQGSQTRGLGHGPGETLLTDGTADKVKQAALDKVPGATVLRVETDAQGSPYEAHLQKSDGSQVTVKVDKQFNATAVESGFGPGPRP